MNDATPVAQFGRQSVTALTPPVAAAFVAAQEHLAATIFNRRLAALQSFVRWCQTQGWLADDPLHGVERRPQPRHGPRALDPDQVETTLRGIRDVRDHALFWLIYDGRLGCNEALAINLEDIDWSEPAIRMPTTSSTLVSLIREDGGQQLRDGKRDDQRRLRGGGYSACGG